MRIRDLPATGIHPLDRELLIAFALGKSRSWVIAHGEEEMNAREADHIEQLFERKKNGEPIAYITGTKEFYGRSFIVTPDVLIPRPATESLIRIALELLSGKTPKTQEIDTGISAFVERLRSDPIDTIIDVGTGSGCIAITLTLEGVQQEIIAADDSKAALEIAEINKVNLQAFYEASAQWPSRPGLLSTDVERRGPVFYKNSGPSFSIAMEKETEDEGREIKNKVKLRADKKNLEVGRVKFVYADGPSFIHGFHKPFLLVSNPPYIPSGTRLERSVAEYEPHEALFAGADGMDVIRPLMSAARENPMCAGVVIEMRTDQL